MSLPDDSQPSEAPAIELPEEFLTSEVEELVNQAQAGDTKALNDLFTRYHETMIQVARRQLGARLLAKEEPDDLAQTTFREATRDFARYQYQGEGSLLRWLIQILQNKIRDRAEFYSAGKRDTTLERPIDAGSNDPDRPGQDFPTEDLSVTRVVARDESFVLLHQALEELSAEHRQAITLVFFQGLTLRAAGEKMGGKSEDAVRMMLRRAESKLGDRLKHVLGDKSKD
ncbi:MAG TPA: sigma-70 family RNA polymerase sigma factor [Planctomycetes bacterium]|nr:sigma-70 family RNA polymerase sigma factor [Planctomycetota bacterium]